MTERPILFSGPMVRAILDGRKTQTRRVVTPAPPQRVAGIYRPFPAEPNNWQGYGRDSLIHWYGKCRQGVPGDRLWVKETYRLEQGAGKPSQAEGYLVHYEADGAPNPEHEWGVQARPSIHMPRWACRLLLEITDVRVERLQDCSEADARAEGVFPAAVYGGEVKSWLPAEDRRERFYDTAVEAYAALWDAINGPGAWAANPWVWAISFRRIQAGAREAA